MTDSAKIKIEGDNAALKKSLAESRAMLEAFGKMYDEKVHGARTEASTSGGAGGPAGGGGFMAGFGDFAKQALATFTGLGALQTVQGALSKLKSMILETIQAAADLEVSLIKFDVLFRNAGEGVGFFVSELEGMQRKIGEATGFSSGAVRDSMSVFLKYGQIQGEVFEKGLENAADLAAFMGVDMVRAAEMMGRALQNPAQGMLLLSRAGVRLTKEEKERIKNLQDSMQIQKAQVALNDIIATKFGGLAKRMKEETFAGAMEDVTTEMNKAFSEVGKVLLPSLKDALVLLTDMVNLAKTFGTALAGAAATLIEGAKFLRDVVANLDVGTDWLNDAILEATGHGTRKERAAELARNWTDEEMLRATKTELQNYKARKGIEWGDANDAQAREAMRKAAGLPPTLGTPEEQPSGKSLEGTFEDLEATWKRISGASAENSTTAAVDEQTAQMGADNKELIAEAKTSNALLGDIAFLMSGMPKPGEMAS